MAVAVKNCCRRWVGAIFGLAVMLAAGLVMVTCVAPPETPPTAAPETPSVSTPPSATTPPTIRMPPTAADCLLWKIELPEGAGPWNWQIVVTDDLAIYKSRGKIHAVTRADGTPMWDVESKTLNTRLDLLGDQLICHSVTYVSPMALDVATGRELWRSEGNRFPSVVVENALVCGSLDGNDLFGLSLRDGTIAWHANVAELVGRPYARWVALRGTDGAGLIHVRHGEDQQTAHGWGLVAVDPATGKPLWDVFRENSLIAGAVGDGTIYVALVDDQTQTPILKAYDLKTGRDRKPPRDQLEITAEERNHNIAMKVAGGFLLVESHVSLTAYDLASGERAWRYVPRDGNGWVSVGMWSRLGRAVGNDALPAVVHDGTLLLCVHDGLLAVDLKTGRGLWKYPMGHADLFALAVRDGVAYFMDCGVDGQRAEGTDPTDYLYALDLAKASQLVMSEDDELAGTRHDDE